MTELILVGTVLAAVWLVSGFLLSRWERSRLRRRMSARVRRTWRRAERIVREDDSNTSEREAGDEGDEPEVPPRV